MEPGFGAHEPLPLHEPIRVGPVALGPDFSVVPADGLVAVGQHPGVGGVLREGLRVEGPQDTVEKLLTVARDGHPLPVLELAPKPTIGPRADLGRELQDGVVGGLAVDRFEGRPRDVKRRGRIFVHRRQLGRVAHKQPLHPEGGILNVGPLLAADHGGLIHNHDPLRKVALLFGHQLVFPLLGRPQAEPQKRVERLHLDGRVAELIAQHLHGLVGRRANGDRAVFVQELLHEPTHQVRLAGPRVPAQSREPLPPGEAIVDLVVRRLLVLSKRCVGRGRH